MSERIKWIDCDGFTITHIDLSDLPEGEYLAVIQETILLLISFQAIPSNSSMLLLTNVVNTQVTDRIMSKFIDITLALEGFNKFAHAIVCGGDTHRRLAQIPAKHIHVTRSDQDARSWLVKQAKRLEDKYAVNL